MMCFIRRTQVKASVLFVRYVLLCLLKKVFERNLGLIGKSKVFHNLLLSIMAFKGNLLNKWDQDIRDGKHVSRFRKAK